MSDLHLTKDGHPIWKTDTLAHFNKTIEIIRGMNDIDMIIVTGDLSNDGSQWTYQYAKQKFASLGILTICCPGNHDSIRMMQNAYKPSFYRQLPLTCIYNGWKIILLNTVIPDDEDPSLNKARGFLSEESMRCLKAELEEGIPSIIALHHPPLEPGGWLNRKLLDNRNDFNNLISHYGNARLVIYGHIHYHTNNNLGHVLYSSSTAVGFAFDKELPKFQIAEGKEGFSLIEIDNENISIQNITLYTILS